MKTKKKSFGWKWLVLLIGAVAVWAVFFRPATAANDWNIRNAPPKGGTAIVAFGDSITGGAGAIGHGYPEQLEKVLGKPIVNSGVGGNTTQDGLARIERDVLARDPRIVLLCLGGNDMLRKQPLDTQFDNLRRMIGMIQDRGALVILIGVDGGVLTPGNYNERYEQLARDTGCVLVPDIMDGIMGRPSLMSDNIHPNEKGYAIFVEKIEKHAGKFLRM